MAAYADFTFYTTEYGGTAISTEEAFDPIALKASAIIDQLTYDRAASETDEDTVDKISKAMCAVADQVYSAESGLSDAIKSESIGSHSVTYADNAQASMSLQSKYEQAAQVYLGRTGLMFKGFYSNE